MNSDSLPDLDDETSSKINKMFGNCEEIVGIDHVVKVISGGKSHSGSDQLNAYIGLEPSGKAHLGWMVLAEALHTDTTVCCLIVSRAGRARTIAKY